MEVYMEYAILLNIFYFFIMEKYKRLFNMTMNDMNKFEKKNTDTVGLNLLNLV